jgi:His/Glu/Gln/Arg/opine family amino acid ABC transporter permease subunit
MGYQFDFGPIWQNRALVAEGLLTTLALCAAALALALALGAFIGTLGTARGRAARTLAALYVELMRNVPLLVHMYFWYMALAFLELPPFACAVLGLALYSAAYVAEVVRAAINSVPAGQADAALAIGMTRWQALASVVYPQALRIVAPSLASLCSQLIKDSSLASVITVAELTYQTAAIEGQTFRTFEIYITVAALYIALVLAVSTLISLTLGRPVGSMGARLADA